MMMKIKKNLLTVLLMTSLFSQSFSQEQSLDGFDINKMFVGGSVVLGLGFGTNSQLTLGGNPELGYSIFKNVDLGFCGNYIYSSSSYLYDQSGNIEKVNSTLTGLGIFTRLHITDGFFVQLQPEFNSIKYRDFIKQTNYTIKEGKLKSSSFLVGIGYGTHNVGKTSFFTTILIDLQKDPYSPYRTYGGEISPIIRSGINYYFGQKKKR